MKNIYKSALFVLVIMLVGFILAPFINKVQGKEGYDNYRLANLGEYPVSVNVPILSGDYQYTGNKNVSDKNVSDIWWEYPIFKVGSYKQITNNIRYNRNPDNGICSRAEFCNTLYENEKNKSNIVTPLPPVCDGPGTRVGYWRTDENSLLPFSIHSNANILY